MHEKTVYLHIGISKTGSTTIQKFLHANKDKLASAGVHYVVAGRRQGAESHHRLAKIYKQGADSSEVLKEIRAEILNSDCHSFVISSEMFEYLSVSGISKLKRDFEGVNLVLVVYLRYQDQAMCSMYNELVKKHACSVGFSEHILRTPRKGLLLYGKMLEGWARVLGEDNIRARIFDRSRFYRNDLLQDFLSTIGVSQIYVDTEVPQKNEGISPAAVEILAEITARMNFVVDHARFYGPACKLSGILNGVIRRDFPHLAETSNGFFSSEKEYDAFMSFYENDNQNISRKYLKGESFKSRGYVNRVPVSESDKEKVINALARQLGLQDCGSATSPRELIADIASYWSSELQRLCER